MPKGCSEMENIGLPYGEQTTASAGEVQGGSWWPSNLYCAPATPLVTSAYLQELEVESPDVVVLGMKAGIQGIVKIRCVKVSDVLSARYYLQRWHKRHHIPAAIAAFVDVPSISSTKFELQCERHRKRLLKRQLYAGKCYPNLKLWLRKWIYYIYNSGTCPRQIENKSITSNTARNHLALLVMSRAVRTWRVSNRFFKHQACLLSCLFKQWYKVVKQEKFVRKIYRNWILEAFKKWRRRSKWSEVQRRFIKACKLDDKLDQWKHMSRSWSMQRKALCSFLVIHKCTLYPLVQCLRIWSHVGELRRKLRITHARVLRARYHAQITQAMLAIVWVTCSRCKTRSAALLAAAYHTKLKRLVSLSRLKGTDDS